MKQASFNLAFTEIIKGLSNEIAPPSLNVELGLYKKLWNFFLMGDSYYFVLPSSIFPS